LFGLFLLAVIAGLAVPSTTAAGRPVGFPSAQSDATQQIWLHYDFMVAPDHSDAPDSAAIQLVVDAFAAHGIQLHIDPEHTAIPEIQYLGFAGVWSGYHDCPGIGEPADFFDLKARYFHPTSNHEWHYAIFGYNAGACASGIALLPGDDFFVSIGPNLSVLDREPRERMLAFEGGTFMHELGHNLNLQHGGGDDINRKPNYISVMNYSYQLGIPYAALPGSTTPIGLRLDYSEHALPALDESNLNEPLGIQDSGSTDIVHFFTATSDPYACVTEVRPFAGPASGPIDWNGNGVATDTNVSADINGDGDSCGGREVLKGFDDWSEIHAYLAETVHHEPKVVADENAAHEPVVLAIDPAKGTSLGGTTVMIHGMHLGKVDRVLFGGTPASNFRIVDVQTIVAVSPPGSGTVDVSVGSGPNPSPWTETDRFAYLRPVIRDVSPHSGAPGTEITIRGDRLGTARDVSFYAGDWIHADSFTVVDDHTIVAQTPTCLFWYVCSEDLVTQVVVTTDAYGISDLTGDGASELFRSDFFAFTTNPLPEPVVDSVTPASGFDGRNVLIRGSGFRYHFGTPTCCEQNAFFVTFGGIPATNVSILDPETITAQAPPGSGTVDVQVWTLWGESTPTAVDRFTYLKSDPATGPYLTQVATHSHVAPGDYEDYILWITDPQPTAATVVVTDELPAETTFVSCGSDGGGVCTGSGNSRTVTFSSLAGGGSVATVNLFVKVNPDVPVGTTFDNTATIASSTPAPDPLGSTATTAVTVSEVTGHSG
jgi:hypothetical protein